MDKEKFMSEVRMTLSQPPPWWRYMKIVLLSVIITVSVDIIFALVGIDHKETAFTLTCTIVLTAFLTEGVQLINRFIDKSVSWFEQPIKRFILQFSLDLGFIFFFSIGIKSVFFYYFLHVTIPQFDRALLVMNVSIIILTFLIVTIDLGIFLIKRWAYSLAELETTKRENLQFHYELLVSQIDPHFLFNSLNTLSSLIYTNQSKAAEFTRHLSKVFRNVLEAQVKEIITVKEELALVDSYLKLMKLRFDENLLIELDEGSIEMERLLPCMTIQLLIENAVNHNIISKLQPLTIEIFGKDELLVIRNRLQVKKVPLSSTGLGLKNIAERYKMIGNREIKIEKTSDYFTVVLPLIQSERS